MEPTVRDILCGLIRRYGHSLCEDPARCQGMLNDLLRGEHRREVKVLVSALKEGITADLLRSHGGLPVPLLLGRLRKHLEDDLMLRTDAAYWAVETWALALGVIDTPMSVQHSPSPPSARPALTETGAAGTGRSSSPSRLAGSIPPKKGATGPYPPSPMRLPFEPEMVVIPAGRFLMGSPPDEPERQAWEGPQHWVEVPAFELGRYAVTFDEWEACVADGGCTHKPYAQGWGRGQRPVINVSWNDAQEYARWLSLATGKTYRLPSEAEWEYACRAGTTTPYHTGRCIHTDQANYNGNNDYNRCGAKTSIYLGKTQPVGNFPPNPWGLHEMHGNVWEWTADCWNGGYTRGYTSTHAPTDGSAWQTGDCAGHVVRGGSWGNLPSSLRAAFRRRFGSSVRYNLLGFRVARTLTH